jgi:hypothetical protein
MSVILYLTRIEDSPPLAAESFTSGVWQAKALENRMLFRVA